MDERALERFAARARAHLREGDAVVVGVSGGLDSVVLLHLLRFHPGVPHMGLEVAHFDHRLRSDSPADARWVGGLARAWGLPCHLGVAPARPSGEAEARAARYRFLEQVRASVGADLILTGHHADDQAETVLFRVLRGTGLAGLKGMTTRSDAGRLRLLLPFWRAELERYARRQKLGWRSDSTNADLGPARNRIRHELLPVAERHVAAGARRALVRLSRHAAREERAWQAAESILLERVIRDRSQNAIVLDLPAFRAYDAAIRARLLRTLAHQFGVVLDEAGTRVAMAFTSRGSSGAEVHLADGLRLRRSFDELHYLKQAEPPVRTGVVATIDGPRPGRARVTSGPGTATLAWGSEPTACAERASFATEALEFPLVVRGWQPGDRIGMPYGTKRVAKLLAEAGVARWRREGVVVVVDRNGRVLWVPGVARSVEAPMSPGLREFHIGWTDAHSE